MKVVNIKFFNMKKTYLGEKHPSLQIPGEVKIYAGQVMSVLGYSASGKSTLLNQLALLDSPDKGSVLFVRDGDEIVNTNRFSLDSLSCFRLEKFGFVFQSGHLLSHFNTAENIALPLYLKQYNPKYFNDRLQHLIQMVFPEEEGGNKTKPSVQLPDTLSGGQYIRAAVARAMAHDPVILFADEPTGNLDPIRGSEIINVIVHGWFEKKREEKSLIFVTHDYKQAFDYSDRILVLANGRLKIDLTKNEKGIFEGNVNLEESTRNDYELTPDKKIRIENSRELLSIVEKVSGKADKSSNKDKINENLFVNLFGITEKENKERSRYLLRFSCKFAFKDLIFNRRMTIMNIMAIGVLIFSSLVIGGILYSADELINYQINSNPLLKRLILSASDLKADGSKTATRIDGEHVEKVMSLKRDTFGDLSFTPLIDGKKLLGWKRGDVVEAAMPVGDPILTFYKHNNELAHSVSGRTIPPSDPVMKIIKASYGNKNIFQSTFFDDKGKGYPFGIILDEYFLNEILGFSHVPKNISILHDGKKTPLRIIGTAESIPGEAQYLITDQLGYALQYKIWVPYDLYDEVYIGPFAKNKAILLSREIRESIHRLNNEMGYNLYVKEFDVDEKKKFLKICINQYYQDELWGMRDFRFALQERIEYILTQRDCSTDLIFQSPIKMAGVQLENLSEKTAKQIALSLEVFFYKIEDLLKAPKVLNKLNLKIETENLSFVKQLVTMKKFGCLIFWVVFSLVTVTAGFNIFLSFFQAVQRKEPQIGIMRAFGASRFLIIRSFLMEALIIWLLAVVAGIGASILLGPAVGDYMASNFGIQGMQEDCFVMPVQLLAVVFIFSLLLCVFGVFWAVFGTIMRSTPANAVRYRG